MLILGIAALIGVGLSWQVYGVVMEKAPKNNIDANILVGLEALLVTIIGAIIVAFQQFPKIPVSSFAICGGSLILSGIFNNRQLCLLSEAMQHGPNGTIWSIAQSGFIFPFLMGVIFFSVPLNTIRCVGLLSMIISLFIMGNGNQEAKNKKVYGKWKLCTFAAFLATGISQALSNLPSYYDNISELNSVWRTMFTMAGCALGAFMFAVGPKRWKKFTTAADTTLKRPKTWIFAICLVLCNLIPSFFLLFPGMDILAKANAGAIAYPIMVASCIIGFEIYAITVLKEKRPAIQIMALFLCLVGVAAICYG